MSRTQQNTAFTCAHCGTHVPSLSNGSYRNHCHVCLWSLHVDVVPGDRAADCHALMEPVMITQPRGKPLAVVHRCMLCGHRQTNRLALDDPAPDSIEVIAAIQHHAWGSR